MSLTSLPRPATASEPRRTPVPSFFAASEAFAVLRAWRAWSARSRERSTSGFMLLRADAGPAAEPDTLVLATEDLGAPALIALGHQSHTRLTPITAPASADATLAGRGTPSVTAALRALDDWAIEILLRTAETVCRSLVVGVRHRDGRFELVAWTRADASTAPADAAVLVNRMGPWLER